LRSSRTSLGIAPAGELRLACHGLIAFWMDDKLCGDFPNLRLRNTETLEANTVNLNVHAGNPRAHRAISMWFDDVVVATAYVGPQLPAR
jgi:hypothetical protein